jgi:hypothetical protein
MYQDEELRMVVEELVHTMHLQARQLEQFTDRLGQMIGRLPGTADLAVVRSELAALHVRAKRLVAAGRQKV